MLLAWVEGALSFESAKVLGGVGSILVVLSMIPHAWPLGVVGLILLLIALRELSRYYGDPSIFDNALIAVILAVIGLLIGGLVVAASVLAVMPPMGVHFPIVGMAMHWSVSLASVLIFFLVLFGIAVVSAVFFRRSLYTLAWQSGEDLFRVAGLLYLIGAVLVIAFGVGLLIILVAFIVMAVAFLTLRPRAEGAAF